MPNSLVRRRAFLWTGQVVASLACGFAVATLWHAPGLVSAALLWKVFAAGCAALLVCVNARHALTLNPADDAD